MSDSPQNERSGFAIYLAVVRRQFRLLLTATLVVPAIAFPLSSLQEPRYQGQAEVLVRSSNLGATLRQIDDPDSNVPPDRFVANQVELARTSELVLRVRNQARKDGVSERAVNQLVDNSSVEAKPETDLLVFSVTDKDPHMATRLATIYARQFVIYKLELERSLYEQANMGLDSQLNQVGRTAGINSVLYRNLVDIRLQLQQLIALPSSSAHVVSEPTTAAKVWPRPSLSVLLGLMLGLLLGIGLALLREGMDTRVRSADEIAYTLDLPLLARLPLEALRRAKPVMLDDSETVEAEAFRFLGTSFSTANLAHGARVIMVTSAIEHEGASIVAANLALALARSGSRVSLVDLDFRRPTLHRLFGLPNSVGFAEVAVGKVEIKQAIHRVVLANRNRNGNRAPNGDGQVGAGGLAEVLSTGVPPGEIGEFVGGASTMEALNRLRERVDIILIDSPPMLQVGDAWALLPSVDALLIVTRLNHVERAMLNELSRFLETITIPSLGVVVTGVPREPTIIGPYRSSYDPTPRQSVM